MICVWTPDYFIRLVELPPRVKGVTLPNDDGTFDIYINALLSPEDAEKCLEHEIRHISKDHFYTGKPVSACEKEADGQKAPDRLPNVFKDNPPGTIPIFNSLEVFRDYMFSMREQYKKEKAARR